MATLQAIKYRRGSLEILDQLLLPFESVYEEVKDSKDGHKVIRTMKVRGAPAIAIVAALSLAVELHVAQTHRSEPKLQSSESAETFILEQLEYLKTSRPTAVNLFDAAGKLAKVVQQAGRNAQGLSEQDGANAVVAAYLEAAEVMLQDDIKDNKNIGKFGAEFILENKPASHERVQVLTHCNTGSLATAGWGTALGIIRDLHGLNVLEHAYCTETRPYNQGSRLTAYELVYEKIPATLICDNMASALLSKKPVTAIVVGADRVAANGDTANKIGTYQLAIAAKHHGVLFIVAAPSTSIDLNIQSGAQIPIEERSGLEVVRIRGQNLEDEAGIKEPSGPATCSTVHIAAHGINVWNPAFDVTPAHLISAIVTEKGVVVKKDGAQSFELAEFLASR
ncbi:uncharacterized protein BJ171DRAFT_519971 [Polychytrium aggregatum]|uniref:uncharacterized protein n=1 Tax=Polychytrium aggregatum TaxID=110093 RepID=UPI0022FEDF28|nr:uncharacterized protein BJ171DRAFT_519971 [Polychytrium aggregatum]KAI9197337.1 hypothetical protein BJ171DRAFT_519971 [Polychytrium aggregatum]